MRCCGATGGFLLYRAGTSRKTRDGFLSVALGTAAGFGIGLLGGVVLGEWLGVLHPERVRQLLGRRQPPEPLDPEHVERAVRHALRTTPATRRLDITVRALDGGIVELTGTVADEHSRRAAGDIAAAVVGADVLLNRVLVEGRDIPPGARSPGSSV